MRISRQYQFEFGHPVDRLWALVSDTPRWGEATGLPRYRASEALQPDGTVKVTAEVEIAGVRLAWEEPPVDWMAGRWFEQQRLFVRGPFQRMTTRARLEDLGEHSRLHLELVFDCDGLIGSLLARRAVANYEGQVRELLHTASELIEAEQPDLFVSRYQPPASALQRAAQMVEAIADSPYAHGLAPRLLDYINTQQEVDLWSMRPIAIARRWKASARRVIELFLQSVRSGLLESRWDILCPRCRISRAQVTNMSDLPNGVHCDACNIDFESDFASNVELSFSPSPSIRPVEYGYFCRSGPGVTPHIKGQCRVLPGSTRSLPLALRPGQYRLRTLEAGDEVDFDWEGGRFPSIEVSAEHISIGDDSPADEISLTNRGEVPRTVVIEERSWMNEVLTAARVTTMQAFRDLFSEQVLRPGDDVSIRNISFMFTDLVDSSALFSNMGDAEAYHLVREHFAMLGEIVRDHQGSVVKTVGDGIHAAFLTPDDALHAAIAVQRAMPGFNRRLGLERCAVRIGLHSGSSISVMLNDRLDYYGEAVNLAARLEGLGEAGEITMSAAFTGDPAVANLLETYAPRKREVTLKGFLDPVSITQISPGT